MGNCISVVQCYQLMKCLEDIEEEENLNTQLLNSNEPENKNSLNN
jgi:hypothetical protein